FLSLYRRHPASPLFPYPTLFRSGRVYGISPCPLAGGRACTRRVEDGETALLGPNEAVPHIVRVTAISDDRPRRGDIEGVGALKGDRKSTRLNSSHVSISYAVFCL